MHNVVRKSLMAVVAAAAVTTMVSGIASADPATTYPGSATYATASISSMGSDTVQAVENGYAAFAAATRGAPAFESWDAINPSTGAKHDLIKNDYRRANGSGEGQAAISRAIDGGAWPKACGSAATTVLTGKIQFARSSGGPKNPGTTDKSELTFIPFARDAVSYAYNGTSTTLGKLTLAQIRGIYAGTITTVAGVTVHPYLPQAGSGTRSFFLKSVMGLGSTEPAFWGSLPTFEENDASVLSVVGRLVPFSAANWIAQKNLKQTNTITAASLGSPDGTAPYVTAGSKSLAPNPTFYASTIYGRDVYNVVSSAAITKGGPKFNKDIYALFVSTPAVASFLRSADAVTTAFGFSLATVGVNGSTTLKGDLFANPSSLSC